MLSRCTLYAFFLGSLPPAEGVEGAEADALILSENEVEVEVVQRG